MKERQNMSNDNEMKNKITNWLLEEGITFTQVPDDAVEFRLRATYGGYFIDIVKEKGMKRLVCVGNLAFHEKAIQAYAKLPNKKARTEFRYDLLLKLTKLPPGCSIQPTSEIDTICSIVIDHLTFLDELNKTFFMRSMQSVAKSLHIANLFSLKTFGVDVMMPNSSSGTSPGVS